MRIGSPRYGQDPAIFLLCQVPLFRTSLPCTRFWHTYCKTNTKQEVCYGSFI
jgi:hypothetical protein